MTDAGDGLDLRRLWTSRTTTGSEVIRRRWRDRRRPRCPSPSSCLRWGLHGSSQLAGRGGHGPWRRTRMSSTASPARRRGAWRAVSYGVGGCAVAIVLALSAGPAGSEVFAGTTSTTTVAVIGPLGGLAGTTVASRRYRSRQLTSHDLALFWCAMTAVIVISTYVYLRVDQASTATALITGAAGLRVMRIGLMERSAGHAGQVVPRGPRSRRLRAHPR